MTPAKDISTLPIHLDPSVPLNVPDKIRERLRKNGNQHKYRAQKYNEEPDREVFCDIENFDVTEVYDEQNWTCNTCFKRVDIYAKTHDPMAPVCGHKNNLKNGGGHTRKNVHIQHRKCNQWLSDAIEKRREKKIRSLRRSQEPEKDDSTLPPWKRKRRITAHSGGIQGHSKWPPKGSQKIKSRNTLRKKK